MAAVMCKDDEATAFEYAQRRLTEWGFVCRDAQERLDLPRQSSISRMIERVRVFEGRSRSGVRKKRGKKRCDNCGYPFGRGRECPKCKRPVMATGQGPETESRKPRTIYLPSSVVQVDAVISRLPGWMRCCIILRYRDGLTDKRAAQNLRVPRAQYQRWCAAAIERVSELLAERSSGQVKDR